MNGTRRWTRHRGQEGNDGRPQRGHRPRLGRGQPTPKTGPDPTSDSDTRGDTNGDTSTESLLSDRDTGQPANSEEDKPLTRADLEDAAQRIADRQVNALLKEFRVGKNRRRERDSDGDNREDNDRTRSTDDRYDTREARMGYRCVGASGNRA